MSDEPPTAESAPEQPVPEAAPVPPAPEAPPPPRPKRRVPLWRRILVVLLVVVFVVPTVWVALFRLLPPPVTPLMLIRLGQGQGLDYRWRPLSKISPALVQAAVAAEDARFCEHHGFDFAAMEKAMAHNQRRPGRIRGGSTISQQTAKNVFLWPDRSYVRKGLEAYFTVLTEGLWGKRRIMETYLNVVEMGPGIYGAEAAAQRYFGVDAAHLSPLQAARLAAIFPNPLKWRAVEPGAYVQRRSRRIGGAIQTVRAVGLAACVGRLSGAVAPLPLPEAAPPPAAAQAWMRQRAQTEEETPAELSPAPESSAPAAEPAQLDAGGPPISDAPQINPSGPGAAPAPGSLQDQGTP